MLQQIFEKTPVTWILVLLLSAIYTAQPRTLVDCSDLSFSQFILTAFIHLDASHFLVNLYSLYQLRNLETKYGSRAYLFLILAILIISAMIQAWLSTSALWPLPTCAIGFSAVLLGLVIYDRLYQKDGRLDLNELMYMLGLLVFPILKNPRISVSGHLAGILAGLGIGVILNLAF